MAQKPYKLPGALVVAVAILALAVMAPTGRAQAQSADGTLAPADLSSPSDQIPDDANPYGADINQNDFDVSVSPENPGAFQQVTVSLDSNLVDLRRYVISWYVNGALAQKAYGLRNFATQTKNYGQPVQIRAVVILPTGNVTKDVLVTPQDISTMWEAVDSYVPPFYQGKKLPAREGIVKIVAVPNFVSNGRSIDPGSLVYSWKRNDNVVPSASAYGTQSLLIRNNKIRASESIQVTASTLDSGQQASNTTSLSFYNPKILFYDEDPETGIVSPFSKSSFYFDTASKIVRAEPYFFSVTNQELSPLRFQWTLNNEPVTLPDSKNQHLLTLQNPGGAGTALLTLSVTSANTPFQTAYRQIPIVFTKP